MANRLLFVFLFSLTAFSEELTIRLPSGVGIGYSKSSSSQTSTQLTANHFFSKNQSLALQLGKSASADDGFETRFAGIVVGTDPLADWSFSLAANTYQLSGIYHERKLQFETTRSYDHWSLSGSAGVQLVGLKNLSDESFSVSTDPSFQLSASRYWKSWSLTLSTEQFFYRQDLSVLNEESIDQIFEADALILVSGLVKSDHSLSLSWARRSLALSYTRSWITSAIDSTKISASRLEIEYDFTSALSASIELGRSQSDANSDINRTSGLGMFYSF